MAKSKYEYVKFYEVNEEIMLPKIIVVRIYGSNFTRFSEVQKLLKPNDKRAVDLMNDCARAVMVQFPDIIFSYGFNNEYSFVFKKFKNDSEFFRRRASKIFTVVTSYFSSTYAAKWKGFFPLTEFQFPVFFKSQVFGFPQVHVLQEYLAWRQLECFLGCEYDAQETIFLQGTCILRTKVEVIAKYKDDGSPVQRLRMVLINIHSENIATGSFWNDYSSLCSQIGHFEENVNQISVEHVNSFQCGSELAASSWIVIRIDGIHFRRFSEEHEFEKPNDARALNLMNSCAVNVLKELKDIVFSYGVSDEYSSYHQFYCEERISAVSKVVQVSPLLSHNSEVVSVVVSLFSFMYVTKWKEFFPHTELKYLPFFDGRAVCYSTAEILLDYLAWRQVDCHINNHYNTCFWMLVKSGKKKHEAQGHLKGTDANAKNVHLDQLTGVGDYYNTLPLMFRRGSCVFWDKRVNDRFKDVDAVGEGYEVVVEHCSIIDKSFWQARPHLLGENLILSC